MLQHSGHQSKPLIGGQASRLASLNVPVVNLTLHTDPSDIIPVVHSDNALIGKLAGEHLMSLGLRDFAFVGHFAWYHNRVRRDGFSEYLSTHDYSSHHIDLEFEAETTGDFSVRRIKQKSLREELSSIPGPLGVMAAHDEFAFEVVEACNAIGRSVPFDVAIIGVNDYRLICETTMPGLSSIAQNSERIGYLAAELVHSLMRGESTPHAPILVPPGQLVVRRSSEFLALDDAELVPVVAYLRDHCHQPITAEDIADHFDMGRKTLDKRFKAALGHTVTTELRMERIRIARRLLTTTNLRVIDVGIRSGFDSASGFVRAFRESTGMTPGQVRSGDPD